MTFEPASRPRHIPWWGALAAILAVAALVRLCNLGTFSLDLDEVFTMTRAVLPFSAMMAESARDADNVPLYLVITSLSLAAGLVDPWIRLIPIAAGLASIVAWAWWARRHFGDPTGLLLAGSLALSTFHLRYSQELRAYPYLLLATALAMLAADRLRARPGPGSALLLALVVATGWYLHFSFALVFAPLLGMLLAGDAAGGSGSGARRRALAWAAAAVVAGTAAFLPWFLHVRATLSGRLSRGANDWSLDLLARRWQFLTVAANESEAADWLGLALAVLAGIGLVVAARSRAGRAALLPAVAAAVVCELALLAVNRWSQGRYQLAVWPLLALLLVLGAQRIGATLRWRWLRTVAAVALIAVLLLRVDAYHRLGRPHWDRVAAAVAEVRRPGEPVLTENNWSQVCLSHYSELEVESLHRSSGELSATLASHPSVLLFAPSRYRQPAVQAMARRGALIAEVPRTGRLVRLRPDMLGLAVVSNGEWWPEPATELVPEAIEQPLPGCLARVLRLDDNRHQPAEGWSRLELDASSAPYLRSGWSSPSSPADGSVRLVTGPEAAVVAPRPVAEAARVSLRVSSLRGLDRQELRLLVNGRDLGTRALERAPQIIDFDAPAEYWKPGGNLLVLQLREVVKPREGRGLPRAAAVDWIEITPVASTRAEPASAAPPALIQDVGQR